MLNQHYVIYGTHQIYPASSLPLSHFLKYLFFLLIVGYLITSAFLLISNLFISYLLALPQKICVLIGVYQSLWFFFFFFFFLYHVIWGFLSAGKKNPPANAGDAVSIPGSERSPGEENDNLLQYSCLGIPMDRGAWRVTYHGVAKNWTQFSD